MDKRQQKEFARIIRKLRDNGHDYTADAALEVVDDINNKLLFLFILDLIASTEPKIPPIE